MSKFFGNIIAVALLSLFVFIGFADTTFAQNELLFGQNHFYTIILRGNGEAVTYAKMAITNSDERPLTDFSFEVPKVSPTEMVIYQVTLPQECVSYNYNDPARPCLQYRDPDYSRQFYSDSSKSGKPEYQKIQYTKSGSIYKFTLPTSVDPYKSTAFIIAYTSKGYVKKSVGLYKFNFETLKVSSRIKEIRVAVDVDSDLLLKGKKSSVNYDVTGLQSLGVEYGAATGLSSRSLDSLVGRIGSYGMLEKNAKNLSPNESFTVKGEYATNWFRLYFSSLLLTVLIISAIFAGVYLLAKFLKKRSGQSQQFGGGKDRQTTSQISLSSTSVLNLTHALVSALSVVGVVGLTYLFRFISESEIFYSYDFDPVFGIIMLIVMILTYVLMIIGPAIAVTIKHGWKSFLSILIAEFLWFLVFFVIYLTLFNKG